VRSGRLTTGSVAPMARSYTGRKRGIDLFAPVLANRMVMSSPRRATVKLGSWTAAFLISGELATERRVRKQSADR